MINIKNKKKRFQVSKVFAVCLIGILGSLPLHSKAQNYDSSIGLRAGGTSGFTYKKNLKSNTSFEGLLGLWNNGFGITALVEKNVSAFDTPNLSWYYGAGGHFAIYGNNGNGFARGERRADSGDLGIGVDGILGLEYKFDDIPFSMSIGVKPFLEFDTSGNTFLAIDPGFGIRYILK